MLTFLIKKGDTFSGNMLAGSTSLCGEVSRYKKRFSYTFSSTNIIPNCPSNKKGRGGPGWGHGGARSRQNEARVGADQGQAGPDRGQTGARPEAVPLADAGVEERRLVAGVGPDQEQHVALLDAGDARVQQVVGAQVRAAETRHNDTTLKHRQAHCRGYSARVPTVGAQLLRSNQTKYLI